MTTLREKRMKRANLVYEARQIDALAKKEKRSLTSDEEQRYDAIMDEATNLGQEIQEDEQRETRSSQRQQWLEQEERDLDEPDRPTSRPDPDDGDEEPESRTMQAIDPRYRGVLREARAARTFALREAPEYRSAFNGFLRGMQVPQMERRDGLVAGNDPSGGFLKPPPSFVARLLMAVDNIVFFRQPGWATVVPLLNSDSLGIVSLDSDPDDGEWTTEIAEITYDASMSFGKREQKPNPLKKGIKISRKLLRLRPDSEQLVIDHMRYKFAVTQEKKFMTGNGSGQPLGVFTASTQGISTSRDVATDNTSTAMTADGLINAKFTLKPQYWPEAKWLFHRDGVKQLAKLKNTTTGEYIWRESVRAGEPDRLLNLPLSMSEYAPNTFTSGLYVGILGAFGYYQIVDSLEMDFQRLVELYAKTGQIGFHAELETDGMPLLEEAFVRVKLG
jgi:HK97 family phage major capsid protein